MLREKFGLGLVVLASLAPMRSSDAAVVLFGDSADSVIRKDGTRLAGAIGRLGAATSPFPAQQGGRVVEYVFQLPTPGPGEQPVVSSASLQFTILSDDPDGAYNIDLYGLGARATSAVISGDYYAGPFDTTDATLLQGDIIAAVHPDKGVETITTGPAANAALVAYLNAQYGIDGAGAGRYVFLRMNPDTDPPNQDTGVDIAFAENSTGKPQLTVTLVPEPTGALWAGVMIFWAGRRTVRGRILANQARGRGDVRVN